MREYAQNGFERNTMNANMNLDTLLKVLEDKAASAAISSRDPRERARIKTIRDGLGEVRTRVSAIQGTMQKGEHQKALDLLAEEFSFDCGEQ